jgi:hypothetical protein
MGMVKAAEIGEQIKQRVSLLAIVESSAPPNLWVSVDSLPELGPSDSKKRFENTIERLLTDVAEADISSPTEFVEELPQGTALKYFWIASVPVARGFLRASIRP